MGTHFSGKKVPQMAKFFHLKNLTIILAQLLQPFLVKIPKIDGTAGAIDIVT